MVEHRMVRWVLKDFNLHNVHLSKTFLTVSELNDISDPENKECITVVLDAHHLVNESVKMSDLLFIEVQKYRRNVKRIKMVQSPSI